MTQAIGYQVVKGREEAEKDRTALHIPLQLHPWLSFRLEQSKACFKNSSLVTMYYNINVYEYF